MPDTRDIDELYQEIQEAEKKKAEAQAAACDAARKEKPADDTLNHVIRDFVTVGTPACGLLCAVIGLAVAVLLMTIGFWKTLLVAVFGCVGGILGGVFDKSQWLKEMINRLFPPKH